MSVILDCGENGARLGSSQLIEKLVANDRLQSYQIDGCVCQRCYSITH